MVFVKNVLRKKPKRRLKMDKYNEEFNFEDVVKYSVLTRPTWSKYWTE